MTNGEELKAESLCGEKSSTGGDWGIGVWSTPVALCLEGTALDGVGAGAVDAAAELVEGVAEEEEEETVGVWLALGLALPAAVAALVEGFAADLADGFPLVFAAVAGVARCTCTAEDGVAVFVEVVGVLSSFEVEMGGSCGDCFDSEAGLLGLADCALNEGRLGILEGKDLSELIELELELRECEPEDEVADGSALGVCGKVAAAAGDSKEFER